MKNFDAALEDAEKCVSLKPDWAKGYSRLGGALYGKQDWDACVNAYKQGLEVDPNNALLQSGLKDAEAEMNKPAGVPSRGMSREFHWKLHWNEM